MDNSQYQGRPTSGRANGQRRHCVIRKVQPTIRVINSLLKLQSVQVSRRDARRGANERTVWPHFLPLAGSMM